MQRKKTSQTKTETENRDTSDTSDTSDTGDRGRRRGFTAALLVALAPAAAGAAEPSTGGTTLLPETVVTATRTETESRRIGSAISVITGEELERRQTRFVADALRTIPGLAVNRTSTFGSSTDIRIRGAEANQTLVLIDGVEVNDPALSSQFNFGNLLTTDIERIEILRGPQSVLYGSDAVGGVVNIITKRGRGAPVATGKVEYGSFDTIETSAGLSGGGEQYDFAISGTYFKTDGVSAANESRGNSENDRNRNKTAQGKLSLRPLDILEVTVNGRWQRSKLDTDAFSTVAADDSSFSNGIEKFGRGEIKLSLLDDRWQHILSGSLFNNKLESGGGAFGDSGTEGDKTTWQYQTNFSFETPAVADATHTVTVGFEDEKESLTSISAFSAIRREIDTQSIFGLYQLGLFDRLFLSGGGRFDDNDIFADAGTWRATAALAFPETGSKLHASGGTATKNPTLFELFGFTSNFTGNPNLEPEQSTGFDVGVEQKLFGGRVVGDVTFFYNRISNLIQGFGNTAVNLDGITRAKGIEVSAKAQILDGLDVTGSYTWTTTRDGGGEQLVRRPRHIASLNANYGFLEKKKANINLGLRYNGDQRDVAFGPTRRVTLQSYILLDIAASYRVTDAVELFIRGENLLDEDYEEVFTFGTPGISAFGGVRVRFEPLKLLPGGA